MSESDYYEAFKEYGFEIKPLPDNYDPDTYAKNLIMVCEKQDVSYSSSTDSIKVD